jgi:hypothetical protein
MDISASSSQDEIIEISDVSSSSDNDVSKTLQPASIDNAIAVSPKTTSNSIVGRI